jgi:hypothetical protein
MRILLPTTSQDGEFLETLNQIESWKFVILPWSLPSKESLLGQDFWLGSSHDGKTWLLAVVPFGDYDDFDPAESAVAALLDPPKRNSDTIAEILLRIYIARQNSDRLSEAVIDEILTAVQFPEFRSVGGYLPEAPRDWLHLPGELVVGFTLSEHAFVNGHTYDTYSRDSIEAALRVVCGPRHDGLLIGYTFATREVIPLLQWDIDWPLARRGKSEPTRREKVQGDLPWESETDQSLFTLYQHVPGTGFWCAPPYYSKPVVRLRVGGRSQDEAIANWHQCARALRKVKQNIPVSDHLRER